MSQGSWVVIQNINDLPPLLEFVREPQAPQTLHSTSVFQTQNDQYQLRPPLTVTMRLPHAF